MNKVNKINIKIKLRILFLILFVSITTLAYKSVNISEQNKERLKVLHSKSQTVLSLQDKIITPLYKVRQLSQSLVMAPNDVLRRNIRIDVDDLTTHLDIEFSSLKEKRNDIVQEWKRYKKSMSNTQEYLRENFEEGAYINVTTTSKKQFEILTNLLLEVQSKSLNNVTEVYTTASKEAKDVKVEILFVLSIVLGLATFTGWLITRNILTSIHKVQRGLTNFFGYLNHGRNQVEKIEIHTKDEFYEMAKMINQNVANIQKNIEQNEELIKNATKVLESIKGGNLGTRLSDDKINNESLNELRVMMNNMIDNLEYKIQEEIHKRVEQEQILIQQSKLASMGEMIGNIAHQWRQPLAQISAIHMNMRVTYDFDKFTKEYLKEKIKEANTLTSYMSQTISDFQNFFKPQGEKEEFSVQKACEDAYHILESSLKYHGIIVSFDTVEDTIINGYKNEYSQVILNILSNAKDILIEREVKEPLINIEIKAGETYALVKIKDNAGGIKDEIIKKIFDPYFTTRHKTQGTGIGLYMSKTIIERNMNGYINVRNEENGALFTIKVEKK